MDSNPIEVATSESEPELSGPGPCLSVVIPALNEEDGIADIVRRIASIRDGLNEAGVDDLEIIVVDDGSSRSDGPDRRGDAGGAIDSA